MFIYESNEIREKVVRLSISVESSKLSPSAEYYSQETRKHENYFDTDDALFDST